MSGRVITKEVADGRKLVVVNVNKDVEYAPKYSDIREIKRQLIAIYGEKEVKKETNPKYYKHKYRYNVLGSIEDDEGKKLTFFEVTNKTTGQRRLTIKDETTNINYPLSIPYVVDLMRIFADFISDKEKTNIPDEYNWLVPVFNERYAGELIGMILESKDYGVTAKEVMERFKFADIQKARNVLYKFKKAKFLIGQKTSTREMFYTPIIDRIELVNFIKTIFRTEEEDIFDLRDKNE